MEIISIEELINLLYLPMTDNKIINTLKILGIQQPIVDEKYYETLRISINNSDETVYFVFKEVDDLSSEGLPILTAITIKAEYHTILPFKINIVDSYKNIVSKLGKIADFKNKFLKNSKLWILERNTDGLSYALTFHFFDDKLKKIKSTVICIYKSKDDHGLGAIEPNTD